MSERLFDSEPFEVPVFREPRARADAAYGVTRDARFKNDYPPDWDRCSACQGSGRAYSSGVGEVRWFGPSCGACLGMGSWKAMARLLAGHRCERCKHPYIPKGDAEALNRLNAAGLEQHRDVIEALGGAMLAVVEPSWVEGGWSACDADCQHEGPVRTRLPRQSEWCECGVFFEDGWLDADADKIRKAVREGRMLAEASWRILTVHHLDGDKANCRWWNLASLCQRCHLEIQAKVVMERVYIHEHSEWFKPHAAGYYAFVYLGQEIGRDEALERQDELLALELAPA